MEVRDRANGVSREREREFCEISHLLELNLQLLALLRQLQELFHDLVLFFSRLLEVSGELGDDPVSLLQSGLEVLQLGNIKARFLEKRELL